MKKYSKIGSLVWALKKLWKLDWHFVGFIFLSIPVTVVLPLVESYFSKVLIDEIGKGVSFGNLVVLILIFCN
mgnify:FL=1